MTPFESLSLKLTSAIVAATGTVYAVMAYGMEPVDEFSSMGHPWQPTVLGLHVLVAPGFIFVLGMVFRSHVLAKLRSGARARRRSGWLLLGSVAPMAVSGYLLPMLVDERARSACIGVHVATSVVFVVALAAHLVARRGPTAPSEA
jgi:hypothetical protein